MQNKSIKIVATIFSLFVLVAPVFVSAQIQNPLQGGTDIPKFISMILTYLVRIGGIVATFAFIWSGYLFVKSSGNESELTKAKEVFVNTCIGTALLLGAQLIATIITGTITGLTK